MIDQDDAQTIETNPLNPVRDLAFTQFTDTVAGFKTEAEATAYATMLITLSSKLIQGTRGSHFKKSMLQTAIKDKQALFFTNLDSSVTRPEQSINA